MFFFVFFFFNDTATTEIYTLFLHDALPIFEQLIQALAVGVGAVPHEVDRPPDGGRAGSQARQPGAMRRQVAERSEEHTSELQSRQYLVCRLLLGQKTHCQETRKDKD